MDGADIRHKTDSIKERVRTKITLIGSLVARPRTFSAIMAICGLNPNFDHTEPTGRMVGGRHESVSKPYIV